MSAKDIVSSELRDMWNRFSILYNDYKFHNKDITEQLINATNDIQELIVKVGKLENER